jgi:hypothetical protein
MSLFILTSSVLIFLSAATSFASAQQLQPCNAQVACPTNYRCANIGTQPSDSSWGFCHPAHGVYDSCDGYVPPIPVCRNGLVCMFPPGVAPDGHGHRTCLDPESEISQFTDVYSGKVMGPGKLREFIPSWVNATGCSQYGSCI